MKRLLLSIVLVAMLVLLAVYPFCTHEYAQRALTEGTCTHDGSIIYACTRCGDQRTTILPKLGHAYSSEIIKEATCAVEGEDVLTCVRCGDSYLVHIHTVEHTYVEESHKKEGYMEYICQVCGDDMMKAIAFSNTHSWSTWSVTKISTYSEAGEYSHVCDICNTEEPMSLGCLDRTPEDIQEEMLRLVNIEREKAGVEPLTYFPAAQIAADARVQDLNLLFSHSRPDGSKFWSVMDDYSIAFGHTMSENIARGFYNAKDVMKAWMKSEGHRQNILNPNFTRMVVAKLGDQWVQIFCG